MADEINGGADSTEQAAEGGSEQAASAAQTETKTPVEGTPGQGENLLQGAKDKSDGVKPEDGEKTDEKTKDVPKGAPESYADFKEPEGVKFDGKVIDAFKEAAKGQNLTQAQAQGLLDKLGPAIAQRQMDIVKEVSNQWAERSKVDKELAADWTRTMSNVAKVRDRFAYNADGSVDPDIAEFMSSPWGNHPGCLKLLSRTGGAISEAGFPRGDSAKSDAITPEAFYKSAKK